jgi:hypothetical protein
MGSYLPQETGSFQLLYAISEKKGQGASDQSFSRRVFSRSEVLMYIVHRMLEGVWSENMANPEKVLIDGQWRPADATGTFQAINPSTGEKIGPAYPVSSRKDVDAALHAGSAAAEALLDVPPEKIGEFLDRYAHRIDERSKEIAETAHLETALPLSPRLADVELPRASNQLRQAAAAARERSWTVPTIDTRTNILDVRSLGWAGGCLRSQQLPSGFQWRRRG